MDINNNDLWECEKCGTKSTHIWRCKDCQKCDVCGITGILIYTEDGLFCDKHNNERIQKYLDEFDGDTSCTNEIVCPYCGSEHSDSWEMSDDGETECDRCEKPFFYQRNMYIDYTSKRKD